MIVLFTDFGLHGPYTGQMKAVLHQMAPNIPVIDLFSDAPVGNPKASAYLLASYAAWFSAGAVFLCVVDPGVGGARPAIILEADGRWYVGPGNGLFELVQRRARQARSWDITWKPERLSASFHGRDLFAPVAKVKCLLGRRISLQALRYADQDHRSSILVFRRPLYLIACEIEDDGVLAAGRKMEGIPIDRDLAIADPEEAPEVDDRSTHLPALIDDHVDYPPHILTGAAADLPAQHRIVLFEHRGGHFGGSPTACLITRGFGCLGDLLQWHAPRIVSGGRRGRA